MRQLGEDESEEVKILALDCLSLIRQLRILELCAFCFRFRANGPKGKK